MNLRKVLSLSVATAVIAALGVAPASAQLQQFASFLYNSGQDLVSYNNGNLGGTDIPIRFNYNTGAESFLGTPSIGFAVQDAFLTFTAARVADAGTAGPLNFQSMNLSSFAIRRSSDNSNLLSGSVIPSLFSGTSGGATASIEGSVSSGSAIVFTSDYLTFPTIPPSTNASLTWTFNNITPLLGLSGNNIQNFNSTVQGAFSYTPPRLDVVPEPGTVALLGALGVIGTAFGVRRFRK